MMNNSKYGLCELRTYTSAVETHMHGYGQLLFPLQGSMDLQTPSQQVLLTNGHCLYLPPSCSHSFYSPGRNEFLVLDIPLEYVPPVPDKLEQPAVRMAMDESWNALRFLLRQEAASRDAAPALGHLVQYICGKLPAASFASIDYIHRHFREELTIRTLAGIEHYHSNYYAAWFKKTTGVTPSAYILELRMKEAKLLLRDTSRPISSISEEVGYEYAASFSRIFTRYEGMSPHIYRRQVQQTLIPL